LMSSLTVSTNAVSRTWRLTARRTVERFDPSRDPLHNVKQQHCQPAPRRSG
jgi:hypothetical protein